MAGAEPPAYKAQTPLRGLPAGRGWFAFFALGRLRQLTTEGVWGIMKSAGAWRSLVAHLYGVQVVAGSNPVAPI